MPAAIMRPWKPSPLKIKRVSTDTSSSKSSTTPRPRTGSSGLTTPRTIPSDAPPSTISQIIDRYANTYDGQSVYMHSSRPYTPGYTAADYMDCMATPSPWSSNNADRTSKDSKVGEVLLALDEALQAASVHKAPLSPPISISEEEKEEAKDSVEPLPMDRRTLTEPLPATTYQPSPKRPRTVHFEFDHLDSARNSQVSQSTSSSNYDENMTYFEEDEAVELSQEEQEDLEELLMSFGPDAQFTVTRRPSVRGSRRLSYYDIVRCDSPLDPDTDWEPHTPISQKSTPQLSQASASDEDYDSDVRSVISDSLEDVDCGISPLDYGKEVAIDSNNLKEVVFHSGNPEDAPQMSCRIESVGALDFPGFMQPFYYEEDEEDDQANDARRPSEPTRKLSIGHYTLDGKTVVAIPALPTPPKSAPANGKPPGTAKRLSARLFRKSNPSNKLNGLKPIKEKTNSARSSSADASIPNRSQEDLPRAPSTVPSLGSGRNSPTYEPVRNNSPLGISRATMRQQWAEDPNAASTVSLAAFPRPPTSNSRPTTPKNTQQSGRASPLSTPPTRAAPLAPRAETPPPPPPAKNKTRSFLNTMKPLPKTVDTRHTDEYGPEASRKFPNLSHNRGQESWMMI